MNIICYELYFNTKQFFNSLLLRVKIYPRKSDNNFVMTKDPELERLKRETEDLDQKVEDLEAINLHFKRMAQTLGKSPNRQLKWLVSFLLADLPGLKEDKRLILRCELAYLASFGNRPFTGQSPILSGKRRFHFSLVHPMRILPDNDFLERCQRDFSQKVSVFMEHHHAQFDLFSQLGAIHVWNKPGGKPVCYLECPTGEDGLQWWLASLLTDRGQALRRCLPCQKLFIATRRDRKFCSSKCRGLSNMRLQRKTSVDRYGKPGRPKKT